MNGEVYSLTPRSELGPWVLAFALCSLSVGVLMAVLNGAVGSPVSHAAVGGPPDVVLDAASTPAQRSSAVVRSGSEMVAGPYALATGGRNRTAASGVEVVGVRRDGGAESGRTAGHGFPSVGVVVARPVTTEFSDARSQLTGSTEGQISASWEADFYPIYGEAQRVFDVDWLLVASIHKQESAFSTAPSTYRGLNFAGCCGGPMQFNVTNGPVSTWDLVRNAYRYGRRPTVYDHHTATHPSIYDDYDSIMAAAWLLSSDGASLELDDSAWGAAYDYYGHDAAGVEYADEVLARAIGWSQHGFCINCAIEPTVVKAVYEAYGAPVMATYTDPATVARTGHPSRPSAERVR